MVFFTAGIAFFVFPFFANAHYAKFLLRKGYLTEQQWEEKKFAANERIIPTRSATAEAADTLLKLAELRDKGIISEEEFQEKKSKIF